MENKLCQCKGCVRNHTLQKLLGTVNDETSKFMWELWEDLVHAEMDAAYYKAIVQGTWPDSDEVIKSIRKTREMKFQKELEILQQNG